MENASKALIIAGAILLSILIISLGLMVYNQAKDAATGTGLDEAQISSFNSKFTVYEGSNKTGAQVNALIQQVISSNQAETNAGTGKMVTITFPSVSGNSATVSDGSGAKSGTGSSATTASAKVNTGLRYTVTIGYDKGIVSTINVTQP